MQRSVAVAGLSGFALAACFASIDRSRIGEGDERTDAGADAAVAGSSSCDGTVYCDDFEREALLVGGTSLGGDGADVALSTERAQSGERSLRVALPSAAASGFVRVVAPPGSVVTGLRYALFVGDDFVDRSANVGTLVFSGDDGTTEIYLAVDGGRGRVGFNLKRTETGGQPTYTSLGVAELVRAGWAEVEIAIDRAESGAAVTLRYGGATAAERAPLPAPLAVASVTLAVGVSYSVAGPEASLHLDDVRLATAGSR